MNESEIISSFFIKTMMSLEKVMKKTRLILLEDFPDFSSDWTTPD